MALHSTQATPEDAPARDGGFTLVEVIWALFLLGIIAMAALGLFIHGLSNVAHVQRQQAAVSLANSAMDLARSVSGQGTDANGTTGLLRGRNQTDVTATWNAAKAANLADTSDMTITWDPQLGVTTADQWVPVTTTARVDNQTYKIDTLVGKCWRLKAASSTSQDCKATNPGSTDYILMYRVRVVVRWDEGSSGTDTHTYRLATLVDPSVDATWNTVLKPFAYDDEVSANAGENPCISIVANDTVTYNSGVTSPVSVESSPSYVGTITKNASTCPNGVFFQAGNKSGLTTFNYHVTSSAGESSTPGTVTVHILPKPVAKTIFVDGGAPSDITDAIAAGDPGLTNLDSARDTNVVPLRNTTYNPFPTPDSPGAADVFNLQGIGITMSGTRVMFDPAKSPSGTSFYYYLVDSPDSGAGASYHSETYAQVTIKVDPPSLTPAKTKPYDASASPAWNPISWQSETGNDPSAKFKIISVTGPSTTSATNYAHVKLDGNTATANAVGSALTFSNDGAIGQYVITYKVVAPSGKVSSTQGTYTIQLLPSPKAYAVNFTSTSQTQSITIPTANYYPTTGVALVTPVTNLVGCSVTSYSGFTINLKYTNSTSPKVCTFSYQLVGTGTSPHNLTSTTVGTVSVTRK